MKRFFVLLLILVIGIGGFGMYRGWFGATTAEASGKKGLTLTWDMAKFKEDMGKAGSKIKTMSQSVVAKVKGKAKEINANESELEGKVTSVDAENHIVTIESDGNAIPLTVPDTKGMEELTGKTVVVTLEKSGDTMIVSKITEK